jgi:hypothetical protein
MTRHAREAISLAAATALGEAALQALVTTDWSLVAPLVLLFAFLIGPPLFLALLAWRRRTHPARSRWLFGVAVLIAVGGLSALGYNLYRFSTDPQFRKTPNMLGLIVPLVQWGVILVVWVVLMVLEGRDKRVAPAQAPNSTNPQ